MVLTERLLALISPVSAVVLPRPRKVDQVIGVGFAVLAIVEIVLSDLPLPVLVGATGLLAAVVFTWRRVWPMAALLVVAAATMVVDLIAWLTDTAVEQTFAEALAALAVLYTAGRWGSTRTVATAVAVGGVAVPLVALANPFTEPGFLNTMVEVLLTVVLVAVGLLIRSNKDAREQRELAEALEERNRLANDIHDSFAHHMSAIAIRAEAARQLDDPEALNEALLAIKRSASTGLTDMRHLVAGLRTPDETTRPLPGFGDVQHLASELSSDVLQIDVAIEAEPELIPVSTSAAAYWIAREALTNVCRHATGATEANIRARGTDHHLDLTITDNGVTPTLPRPDGGHGLRSMTERARSLGGDLTAGPNPKGGWLVAARLPLNRGDA